MANVLEATIDAVKNTSGEVAGAARQGVSSVGDQVSMLASKVSELIEPEPKRSPKWWLWGALLLAAAIAVAWWRRASTASHEAPRDERAPAREPEPSRHAAVG